MQLENYVTGRSCGTCSLCCKLLGIGELDKKNGEWCSKCDPPNGCTIYESRPQECRDFACAWLESRKLGEEWKPTTSKMVLYLIDDAERLIVHVNPSSPDAWRRQPYYSQLRTMARQSYATGGPKIVVRIDDRLIAILPDQDVDLGRVAKGEAIYIGEAMTSSGRRLIAQKVPAGSQSPDRPAAGGSESN